MLQTYIHIEKSGKTIGSGPNEKVAVKQFKHTACVNDGDELSIGSVCANAVEITIFDLEGTLDLTAGDEISVARGEEGVVIGRFIIDQPTRPTANTIKIVGYDLVIKLDKDLTGWLNSLTDWPYSIETFAPMVAAQCGLRFSANWTEIPNSEYMIQQFSYTGVTGRMLMRWLSEICARYCYADGDILCFGWYKSCGVTIRPTGDRYYFEGGLTYETYETAPIEAAQLQLADSDSGALWPEKAEGINSYVIRNNAILQNSLDQATEYALDTIAKSLEEDKYTPCKVAIPACLDITPGKTVDIVDKNGKTITAYVMTKVTEGQKATLECTGSPRRDSTKNLNNQKPVSQTDAANAAQKAARQTKDYADQVSKNAESYADEAARLAAQDAVRRQTQEDIFNKLTNNGELQGLFFRDGKWYINAEYVQIYNLVASAIVSGILESVDGKTYFNLNTGEIVTDSGEYKIVIKEGEVSLLNSLGNPRMTMGRRTVGGGDAFAIMVYNTLGEIALGLGVDDEGTAKLYAKQYGGTGFAGLVPAWKFAEDGTTYLAAE